jgi:hypothetical protein
MTSSHGQLGQLKELLLVEQLVQAKLVHAKPPWRRIREREERRARHR